MLDFRPITTRTDLESVCARAAMMQAPQVPLLRAVADGAIALLLIADPASKLPTGFLKSCRRPAVVLVGGDLGAGDDPPPDQWQCVARLRHWCRSAIVHGSGGTADHYRMAVLAAQLHRCVALIECSSAQARPWAEALHCPRTLLILPPDGQHPALPTPELVQ